jgi:hypothetical protein
MGSVDVCVAFGDDDVRISALPPPHMFNILIALPELGQTLNIPDAYACKYFNRSGDKKTGGILWCW